jgi:hypothetical protein
VGERTFTKCFPNVYIITGTESFEAANFFRLPASTTITYTVILRSQVFFMLIKSNDTTHLYSHCKITVTESGHAYVGNYWSRVQHRTGVLCPSLIIYTVAHWTQDTVAHRKRRNGRTARCRALFLKGHVLAARQKASRF